MAKACEHHCSTDCSTWSRQRQKQTACSGQPPNFAGIAAVKLGEVVMTLADYTLAAGDVSGREITINGGEERTEHHSVEQRHAHRLGQRHAVGST